MNILAQANAITIDHIARLMERGEISRRYALDMIDSVWQEVTVAGLIDEVTRILINMAVSPAVRVLVA
jgi:hypothetical protein